MDVGNSRSGCLFGHKLFRAYAVGAAHVVEFGTDHADLGSRHSWLFAQEFLSPLARPHKPNGTEMKQVGHKPGRNVVARWSRVSKKRERTLEIRLPKMVDQA